MSHAEVLARSERLVRLQALLLNRSRGLTSADMAREAGVSRRTIQRDLLSLEALGVLVAIDKGRYQALPGNLMPPLRLGVEEAVALFVAARLLARHCDDPNPWVVAALRKLAAILPPVVGEHVQRCADVADRDGDDRYGRTFGTIARAWAKRQRLRIWYRGVDSPVAREYVVAPFFVEPSAVGFAAYLIGHTFPVAAVRTFKIERIERIEETNESFDPPANFDVTTWLAGAWGVMAGDVPDAVVLRFAATVAWRVKESIWHPSQRIDPCSDGSLLFTVTISQPREMAPWIRGWGPDVEVLAPAELRAQIAADLRQAAAQYGDE